SQLLLCRAPAAHACPPGPSLSPYTTLFRSWLQGRSTASAQREGQVEVGDPSGGRANRPYVDLEHVAAGPVVRVPDRGVVGAVPGADGVPACGRVFVEEPELGAPAALPGGGQLDRAGAGWIG